MGVRPLSELYGESRGHAKCAGRWAGRARARWCAPLDEEAQALDVGGAEGARRAPHGGAGAGLVDLQPAGHMAGEQANAHGDAVGMQAGADEVIAIMPVDQLVYHRLDPPALAIERGQPPGVQPLDTRDVDPRAAVLGRGRAVSASSCNRGSQGHPPRRMAPPCCSQRRCYPARLGPGGAAPWPCGKS